MGIAQEKYEKFRNNEPQFFNIEIYEFIKLGFKTRFHSTLGNKAKNKELFVTFIGIANYVNLGDRGDLGKFSNDESKTNHFVTLQESFYLENYHELLNQISSIFYVGRESTWTSGHELDSGFLFSKNFFFQRNY
jgi:hypothetical protein